MPQTVLVVDDNVQNRVLLKDILTLFGFNVLLAENGAEGVRLALDLHPDLILMDIQMPVMNGLEAGRLLREDPRTRDIKLLATSAFNQLDDKNNFFDTGFDGYIEKPFNFRALPETLKKFLAESENQ